MPRTLVIADNPEDVAYEAAHRFVAAAEQAIASRGQFAVALSGGSTPQRLYTLLAHSGFAPRVDWSRVVVFFADERFVPADHPDSNYRLARTTLLAPVGIPSAQVHPMPTEGDDPDACASAYAETLESYFGATLPAFDLVLLGMGPDGHTASLFPGRPDPEGTVAAVRQSPKPPPTRLTLTLTALNQAAQVLFLVTGADKAEPLRAIFTAAAGAAKLPAARVEARTGQTIWLVDQAAANGLSPQP